MSFDLKNVKCLCGADFEAEVFVSVNVQDDPGLKEKVLGGQLNVQNCPGCRRPVFMESFLLYHDPARLLLAFVYPQDFENEKEKWTSQTKSDFEKAEKGLETPLLYPPTTIFGLDRLADLLHWEEEVHHQGRLVEAQAPALGLALRRLNWAQARPWHIPILWPFARDTEDREGGFQEGLNRLLAWNGNLSLYQDLQSRLAQGHINLAGLHFQ